MRKIFKGVLAGIAITAAVSGSAYAAEQYTVNASEQYVPTSVASELIHAFANGTLGDCGGGSCKGHGEGAVQAWVDGTFFGTSMGSEYVPDTYNAAIDGSAGPMASLGFQLAGPFNAFYEGTTQLSKSLPTAWMDILYGTDGSDGAPEAALTNPSVEARDEWVDQLVLGYVQTGDNFAQNFRSQLTFGSSINYDTGDVTRDGGCISDAAQCKAIIDQRLEQGDTDMENTALNAQSSGDGTLQGTQTGGGERILSAFQQTFGVLSGPNVTSDVENNEGDSTGAEGGNRTTLGQNVEQNMEGYFYSCLNCNLDGAEHEFSAPEKASFQAWLVDQPEITSIIHAGTATTTSRLN